MKSIFLFAHLSDFGIIPIDFKKIFKFENTLRISFTFHLDITIFQVIVKHYHRLQEQDDYMTAEKVKRAFLRLNWKLAVCNNRLWYQYTCGNRDMRENITSLRVVPVYSL